MNILPLVHFFTFLAYFCLLLFLLWKEAKSLLNRVCAAFIGCFTLWSFALIFFFQPNTTQGTAILLDNIGSIGWISFASFYLWFTLIFTEQKRVLKNQFIYLLLFLTPLFFIYMKWAGYIVSDYILESWGWAGIWSSSIWSYLFFSYYLIYVIIAIILNYNYGKKTKIQLKQKQAQIIFYTSLISLIVSTVVEVLLPSLDIVKLPSSANIINLILVGGIIYVIAEYSFMIVTPYTAATQIISTMADSLLLLDRDGNINIVNQALVDLSGYQKKELSGKSIKLLFDKSDLPKILPDSPAQKKTNKNIELNFKIKNGEQIPVLLSSSPVIDDGGEIAGIVCVLKEITELKKAKEVLQKSQEEAISLFQDSPLPGIYHDENGVILNINKKFTELFGYTLEELKGRNINDGMIFPEGNMILESEKLTRNSLAGKDIKIETVRKKKDGTLIPVIITVSAVITRGEKKAIVAFYQDISKQKEYLDRIEESERKFRTLFQNMPAAYYQTDQDGNILMMNPTGIKLLGSQSLDEVLGKQIARDFYYKPADRLKFLEVLKNNNGRIKDYEVILKNKEGQPIIVSTNSQYYYHESGEIAGVEGVFIDITERKKSEEALRKSQREFASLFQNSSEALAYMDENGFIININPRFTELFGYTLEEIKGKHIDSGIIHLPDMIKEGEKLMRKALAKGYRGYEAVRKKKDGTLFPVSISGSAIAVDGGIKGSLGSYTDISERKRNELIQQVLYNISNAANSTISLSSLYDIIHKQLSKLIDTTNFYIALLDREKEEIYFPYSVDELQHIHHPRSVDHNSLIAHIFHTGEPVLVNKKIINENQVFKKYKQWFGQLRQVWLGVPLKIKEEPIGALVVQSYKNPEQYSHQDIKILEIISSQISIAIKRIRDEEALRKSQQEFASLFQSHSEALLYADDQGTILDLNKRFTELFGYTLKEIQGKNINCGIIHPPDKVNEGEELDKRALSQGYIKFETIRKKKDGTLFPVTISGSPVFIDGKAAGIIGTYIDITERKKLEEQLKKMARTDTLTNCFNRRYGLELLARQMKLSLRNKSPLLIAFLDIDNFKNINDRFGHLEGDRVLKEVSSLFRSSLREIDIICRIGGDEFLLAFPDTSLQEASLIKSRLETKLLFLNRNITKDYQIQFSIGFVEYLSIKPKSVDELITIADQQMYEDKKRKNL
jgi:diguanylate cyclase (GGDEF)-like protein/PAS domain S-box-containing protein